jgi:hypothetical protein
LGSVIAIEVIERKATDGDERARRQAEEPG